jgi:hypothetical protein
MHRLAYSADVVAAAGPFSTQPSGPRPVGCFPRCSLDPYEFRYGRFARSLKNSQLIRQRRHHYMRDGALELREVEILFPFT